MGGALESPAMAGGASRVQRFVQLDALRFLFALVVVVCHTVGFTHSLPHGGYAVDFFFVLSGFVLSHGLMGRAVSAAEFTAARLARLYPLHLAALLFLLMLAGGIPVGPGHGPSQTGFVLNLVLLQGLGIAGTPMWNFPSWSISVEFLVNVLLLYPVVRARSVIVAACLAALALVALLGTEGAAFDFFSVQPAYGPILSGGLLRGTLGILGGYLIYEAYLRLVDRIDAARWAPAATFVEGALVAAIFFCLWIGDAAWGALAPWLTALLVMQMATVPGRLSQVLQRPMCGALGDISYSIYLLHIPLFALFVGTGLLPQGNSGLTPLWFLYLPGLLALAVLSFRCFERPAQRRLMQLFAVWRAGRERASLQEEPRA